MGANRQLISVTGLRALFLKLEGLWGEAIDEKSVTEISCLLMRERDQYGFFKLSLGRDFSFCNGTMPQVASKIGHDPNIMDQKYHVHSTKRRRTQTA